MEAPFVKVEATKFTEVGYVGRDVDSIIRDLVEASIRLTKQQKMEEKYKEADLVTEEKIVAAIIPDKKAAKNSNANQTAGGQSDNPFAFLSNLPGMQQYFPSQPQMPLYEENAEADKTANELELAREQVRQQLRQGLLEDQMINIDVIDNKANTIDIGGNENMSISIGSIFGDMVPQKMKKKKLKVKDARKILREQEAQNLLDMDAVTAEAVENAEQNGIVFIDEIDKIADSSEYGRGRIVQRGCAEGYSSDRGGQRRGSEIRSGQDRSYAVYRRRSVPCFETDRSDSGTSGPFPDSGGTGKPDEGCSETDSHRAEKRSDHSA